MTERDPNELYDALRDRLADYGQEPPAHLWAGIRQQLPPPAALPMHRPRRWAGRVLAGGLVSVACLSGWWWHASRETASAGRPALVAHSAVHGSSQAGQPLAQPANPAATSPSAAASANSPTFPSRAATQPAAGLAASTAASASSNAGNVAARHQAAASTTKEGPASRLLASASPGATPAVAGPGGSLAAAVTASTAHAPAPLHPNQPEGEPATRRQRKATAALAAVSAARTPKRRFHETPGSAIAGHPSAATSTVAATDFASNRVTDGSQARPGQTNPAADNPSLAAGVSAQAGGETAALSGTGAPTSDTRPADLAGLPLHPVALALNAWPQPNVRPVADTFPHPALLPPQRWALQLLAGPSLTYRQLDTQKEMAQPARTGLFTSFNDQQLAATSIERLERPAAGFGAQLELRRVLNGRWAVSSGLGYQEYATNLYLRTVKTQRLVVVTSPGPAIPDSAGTSVRLRDTYRFVNIPVRFSYQLGAGSPRFRYALLGGAEVAVYVGGKSSEGNTCACQTSAQSRPVYPYHRLSLALNLGVDLRYRVAPQWELLAQPTATTFLTSLTRPASGLAPRYLLGTGLQLGLSYGLL